MAMNRIMISMNPEDIELFETGREILNMNKSAYVRLLIAEHEKRVPGFIQYKEIIDEFSKLNTMIQQIIISDSYDDISKMLILQKVEELKTEVRKLSD